MAEATLRLLTAEAAAVVDLTQACIGQRCACEGLLETTFGFDVLWVV